MDEFLCCKPSSVYSRSQLSRKAKMWEKWKKKDKTKLNCSLAFILWISNHSGAMIFIPTTFVFGAHLWKSIYEYKTWPLLSEPVLFTGFSSSLIYDVVEKFGMHTYSECWSLQWKKKHILKRTFIVEKCRRTRPRPRWFRSLIH